MVTSLTLSALALSLHLVPVSHHRPDAAEAIRLQFETYYLQAVPDEADAIEARFARLSKAEQERRRAGHDAIVSVTDSPR